MDKLKASEETLTKFVVFAHHKTVLDRLQAASAIVFWLILVSKSMHDTKSPRMQTNG